MRGPLACALVATGCLSKPPPPGGAAPDGAVLGDGAVRSDGATDDGGAPRNLMFVTSLDFGPPWTVQNTDQFCGQVAMQGHQLGNYIAWLSFESSMMNAADRLRALPYALNWHRTDGTLFAATVDDIISGMLANPPRFDENGQDVILADPNVNVATGTTATGGIEPGNDAGCSGGNIEIGSPANVPKGAWTEYGHVGCAATNLRLYCFSFGAH